MTSPADALRQALALHQQGRLAEAEPLYRRVLAKDRFEDQALNLLGVLCHQTGRDAEAVTLLQQAVSRRKRVPDYHCHLGLALDGVGRKADAEQAYRRALSIDPNHTSAMNNLGVLLLHTGRAREAVPLFEQAIARKPGYADAFNNLGLARQRLGDAAGSLAAYEQAVALSPNHAVFLNNLGSVLQVAGQHARAHAMLTRALELRPEYAEAMNNLGLLLHRMGQSPEALAWFARALALKPGYADALHNTGHTLHGLGRLADARRNYEAALAAEPGHVRAALDLASLDMREGDLDAATRRQWAVLRRTPNDAEARQSFLRTLPFAKDRAFLAGQEAQVHELITDVLARDALPGAFVWPAASSVLKARPAWADLPATVSLAHLDALRAEPLLVALWPRDLCPETGFETRTCAIRSALLGAVGEPGAERFLDLACALALHVFLTEFVYDEADEETLAVATLEATFAAAPAPAALDPLALAVYAAYRPLEAAPFSAALSSAGPALPPPLAALVRQTIDEPNDERARGAAVSTVTTIDDEVSLRVRAQYEENPYPRWRLATALGTRPWNEGFRARFPWLSDVPLTEPRRALVAGCGTGQQPIRLALSHAELEVVAVDLSRRSLGYAARKVADAGLADRVHLGHADLLKLPEATDLGLFERAYASGVLHHLREPSAGLRAVLSRLAPGGIVNLGLYSRPARQRLNVVRRWAKDAGLTGELRDIRRLRAQIKGQAADPAWAETAQFRDFYSASECRDLLLHVQEHQFDIPELKAFLAEAGLEFLAFDFDDPRIERRFRQEHASYPGGPEAALRSLDAWHAYEERHTETFVAMYQFYALKR
jgi:tetratricopeptide (TPR) repeat protein/SAM-dependent methyltransferase